MVTVPTAKSTANITLLIIAICAVMTEPRKTMKVLIYTIVLA